MTPETWVAIATIRDDELEVLPYGRHIAGEQMEAASTLWDPGHLVVVAFADTQDAAVRMARRTAELNMERGPQ